MFEKNMHRERSGRAPLMRAIPWMAAVGIAVVGTIKYDPVERILDTLAEINPENVIDLDVQPPIIVAAVDQESYIVETKFDLRCRAIVSASVDVEASQEAWNLFGYRAAKAEVNKKYSGDFLLCGDNEQYQVGVKEIINPITEIVESAVVTLPNVFVFHPRIDMNDPRNCIDGNPGDSPEEIQRKLDERKEAVLNGESPECDSNYDMGGNGVAAPAKFSALPIEALKAAEVALSIDSDPREIIDQIEEEWAIDIEADLRQRSNYNENTKIEVIVADTDQVTLEERVAQISDDLELVFSRVELQNENTELYLKSASGVEITVTLGAQAEIDDEFQYELSEISE